MKDEELVELSQKISGLSEDQRDHVLFLLLRELGKCIAAYLAQVDAPPAAEIADAAPQIEPDADRFREGDIWRTSRGRPHKCLSVRGGMAVFREGWGGGGRETTKRWDDIGAWVRVRWGGKQ